MPFWQNNPRQATPGPDMGVDLDLFGLVEGADVNRAQSWTGAVGGVQRRAAAGTKGGLELVAGGGGAALVDTR